VRLARDVADLVLMVSRSGRTTLVDAAKQRARCRDWLVSEVVAALETADDGSSIAPTPRQSELEVRRGDESVLVRVRAFPTNYGQAGQPITKSVAEVTDDLNELTKFRAESAGLAVMLAYPIRSIDFDKWGDQLVKVKQHAAEVLVSERIALERDETARLYVFLAK
jgi:hypothetical protein